MAFIMGSASIKSKICSQFLLFIDFSLAFYCTQSKENVYRSLIGSVLTFDMYTWFGHLGVTNRNKLPRIVKIVGKGAETIGRYIPYMCET